MPRKNKQITPADSIGDLAPYLTAIMVIGGVAVTTLLYYGITTLF